MMPAILTKLRVTIRLNIRLILNTPLYEVLRKVVLKHLGLEDIVETVLERMGNVQKIILVGDYAEGNDSGNIEVFLIGKGLNMEYISQLEEKIEKLIKRKVSLLFGLQIFE